MSRSILWTFCIVTAVVAASTVGCSSKSSPPSAPSTATDEHSHEHAAPGDGESKEDAVATAPAKLPAEDRPSAEKQRVCLVSGARLGSMGPPVKVDVKGQQVWICCAGCQGELTDNADKYLVKLKGEAQ